MYQCTVYTKLMNVITKYMFHASKDMHICSKVIGVLNQYSQLLVFNTDLYYIHFKRFYDRQRSKISLLPIITSHKYGYKRVSGCGREGSWME